MTPWTPLSMEILQAGILEWVAMFSSKGSSQPRDQTQVSHIAGGLPSETPEKPMNPGVGSLSLLQGIFPTQELNGGLLHCRRILYRLSYQGSPFPCVEHSKTQIGSATCPAVSFFHAFSKCTRNSLGPDPITVLLNDWVFTYIPW